MDFNLNYCGGQNRINKEKKIQAAMANYLTEERIAKQNEEERLNEQMTLDLMKGARTNSSPYARNKERARNLQESLTYRDRTSKNAMAEYIIQIVENALLINSEEYKQLNPNYLNETRELVYSLLSNSDLNEDIRCEETLTIMEHISKRMPNVKTGILLESEDVTNMITKAENSEVEDAIKELSGSVQDNVANIVSAEVSKKQELQNDINGILAISEAAKAKKEEVAEEDPEVEEAQVEEQPVEEISAEEVAEEPVMDQGAEMQPSKSVSIAPDGTLTVNANNKEVLIGADGTLNVSIFESAKFIKEVPKHGILETLAVNEGMKMIREGKEYNGDLALANAINHITVLETFNAMGLLNIDSRKYKELVIKSGGVNL